MNADKAYWIPDYVFAVEDIDRMMAAYPDQRIPAAQRARWPGKAGGQPLERTMFGKDHAQRLELIEHGNEPVGGRGAQTASQWWNLALAHTFPQPDELIRAGVFFKRDLYEILLLGLKAAWERHVATRAEWKPHSVIAFRLLFSSACVEFLREGFNPDLGKMFDLLERYGGGGAPTAQGHGYDRRTFGGMANLMIKQLLLFRSIEAGELKAFAQAQTEQMRLLGGACPDEADAYWVLHHAWQTRLEMLEDLLLAVENCRIRIAETERKWLAAFGAQEIPLREQALRLEVLRERVRRKQANPALTREALEQCIHERIESDQSQLLGLRHRAAMAPLLKKECATSYTASAAELSEYRKKAKTLVRKIFLLTAEDRLKHNPGYGQLTPRQRGLLRAAFDKAKEAKPEDLGWEDGDIRSDGRSLEGLMRVLRDVEHELTNAGVDLDPQLNLPPNTSLAERNAWLHQEIQRLAEDIAAAQSELGVLRQRLETESVNKAQILSTPDKHAPVRADMQQQTAKYRQEAETLAAKLDELFKKEPGHEGPPLN